MLLVVIVLVAVAGWVVASGVLVFRPAVVRPPAHSGPITVPDALRAGGTGGIAITPPQAQEVVRAWWPMRETALATNDVAVTDAIETGPAAEYDDAVSRDNLVRGGDLRKERSVLDARVTVPVQSTLPAYFLVQVLTTTYASADQQTGQVRFEEFLVFVRPDHDTPWKVALSTGAAPQWPPLGPVLASGTAYADSPTGSYSMNPTTLPANLAQFKQAYVANTTSSRIAATFFARNYWTDTSMAEVVAHIRQERSRDLVERRTYSANIDADGFYQFSVSDGSVLVCFVLRHTRTIDALTGSIEQDRYQDNYGSWVAPGRYQQVVLNGLEQTCVNDPGQAGQSTVYGGNGGLVSGSAS